MDCHTFSIFAYKPMGADNHEKGNPRKTVSEHDQELPQSQTADNPKAP